MLPARYVSLATEHGVAVDQDDLEVFTDDPTAQAGAPPMSCFAWRPDFKVTESARALAVTIQ